MDPSFPIYDIALFDVTVPCTVLCSDIGFIKSDCCALHSLKGVPPIYQQSKPKSLTAYTSESNNAVMSLKMGGPVT